MLGKKFNKYYDFFVYMVWYFLGLSIFNVDSCGLIINDFDYKWKDGESIVFDEIYLYLVYNDSDILCIILMIDVDCFLSSKLLQKFYWYFG